MITGPQVLHGEFSTFMETLYPTEIPSIPSVIPAELPSSTQELSFAWTPSPFPNPSAKIQNLK